MKKQLFLAFFAVIFFKTGTSQHVPSPSEFLGYRIGERYTYHHRLIDYFEALAKVSPEIELVDYGRSVENRPLFVAIVSAEENIQQIEKIRRSNLKNTGLLKNGDDEQQKAIVWFSFGVHGNEAATSETAMEFVHLLLHSKRFKQHLDSMVLIIDPCLNPDGHERFVTWYNSVSSRLPNPTPYAWEHHENWWKGRFNHYLFDLNRDWMWQSQKETLQRTALYKNWMPHIHVDIHEMMANASYFFPPSAKPIHEDITDWQREFQFLLGKHHAARFDSVHWRYFTEEFYDLLYPAYGDTWGMFNGAIGLTYEVGGIGAGISLRRSQSDTLSLKKRIDQHLTTCISTVEVAFQNRDKLLREFNAYFSNSDNGFASTYKSYLIKHTNHKGRINALLAYLDRQNIRYFYPAERKNSLAYSYFSGKEEKIAVEKQDILVPASQPMRRLVKVLFEPNVALEDSVTYDITAWALPYIFGLETYAFKQELKKSDEQFKNDSLTNYLPKKLPYAYFVKWNSVNHAQFLTGLLEQKINIRFASEPFEWKKTRFESGGLIIARSDNMNNTNHFDSTLVALANRFQVELHLTNTGLIDGKDIGSRQYSLIEPPKIAIAGGQGTKQTAFGELWHFFDCELNYPVTLLRKDYLNKSYLRYFDIIILPSGSYGSYTSKLLQFVEQGGKLIVLEKSIETFATLEKTAIGKAKRTKDLDHYDLDYKSREQFANLKRIKLSTEVAGCIYNMSLDKTHPVSYGLGENAFVLKRNNTMYPLMENNVWNIGIIPKNGYISGFAGYLYKQRTEQTLAIGAEKYGKGWLYYFPDSPVFRGFWYNGKLLLSNTVFFAD